MDFGVSLAVLASPMYVFRMNHPAYWGCIGGMFLLCFDMVFCQYTGKLCSDSKPTTHFEEPFVTVLAKDGN
jgi:Ca2+/Na+ antiporter